MQIVPLCWANYDTPPPLAELHPVWAGGEMLSTPRLTLAIVGCVPDSVSKSIELFICTRDFLSKYLYPGYQVENLTPGTSLV